MQCQSKKANLTFSRKRGKIMTKKLTNNVGAPVADNQNLMTAGPRGPMLLQDVWFLEKLAHFDREVISERRMHAKGSGAYGTFTVTHDITKYTRAKIFSEIGKKTGLLYELLKQHMRKIYP
jgi:catalase